MKHIDFKDIILYEDDNLIVVNKPAFLPSLDERNGEGQSLLRMAKRYSDDAQLCHRLDRETSGALVIAKNPETYRDISMKFEGRQVEKTYHAVIDGVVRFDMLKVDLPIKVDKSNRVNIDFKEGKDAITYFNTLELFNHFSLIECKPVTGRMHQIRIHLASQNAVITGDVAYRGRLPLLSKLKRDYKYSKLEAEQPMISRFLLHAARISFISPDDKTITIDAPYPKDFEVFLKVVRRFEL
jgi:23S rRNA pseudouridine955/2504/2580 synthase